MLTLDDLNPKTFYELIKMYRATQVIEQMNLKAETILY